MLSRGVTTLLCATVIACAYAAPLAHADVSGAAATWHFNEGQSSVAADTAGGHAGTLSAGATWTNQGKSGAAVMFDGSSGAVTTAPSSSFDNLGPFTVSAWIKPSTLGESSHGWIVGKSSGGGNLPNKGWLLSLSPSDGNTFAFAVDYSSSHLEIVAARNSITLGAWNHVAVTWDGTSAKTGVKLYVNGSLVNTSYAASGSGNRVTETNSAITIGNNPADSRAFNGSIDDVVIVPRILSAGEIQSLMSDSGGTSAPAPAPVITTPTTTVSPVPASVAAPVISMVAVPASIVPGQTSSIIWATSNATSCTASSGWSGSKPLSGIEIVAPAITSTYLLTCTGAGGSTATPVTITVSQPAPTPASTPTPTPTALPSTGAMPTGKILWDWQIGASDESKIVAAPGLQLLDVDVFNTSAAKVAELKAKGIYMVCYINAGSWQPGYPDSGDYPAYLKIKQDPDWPEEYFLDVTDVFKPDSALAKILKNRLAICKQKGFDAVEPDNLQNDENAGGLITRQQQIDFNGWFADAAHAAGLKVLQKNGPDKIDLKTTYDGKSMLSKFDGILNEECQQYNECSPLAKYVAAGKLALNVEYKKAPNCTTSDSLNINTIQKDLNLVGGAQTKYLWNTICLTSGTPISTQTPQTTTTTQAPPQPAPTQLAIGSAVITTDVLKIRSEPSLGQNRIGRVAAGTTGAIVDGPVTADGYVWWKVSYSTGLTGWSAADWLKAI